MAKTTQPSISPTPLPLPNQRDDTLFKDLSQPQRQDIGLLRAFGVVGVGARGDRVISICT